MPTTLERLQVDVVADTSRAVADLHRLEAESRRTAAILSGLGGRPAGIDTSALLADLRRLEAEARRTAGIVGGIGGRTGGMGVPPHVTNTWNTYNQQVSRTRDNMKRLAGITAGAVAGAGIGRIFVGGIQKAMDFDLVMRQVGVQTGQTGDALDSLGETAKQMGADTIYSASEAGQAMLELAKGGLTAAQIKGGALQQALTLAAAGGLELADAGSAVVNGMGAFGLKANEATRITTALAGAANASSSDVSDLTQSLAAGAAAASSAGYSIEETAAAFAIFANNGVKGSDAGTSFKTMIAGLTPVTDKAKSTMRKYGLEFTTADGRFKSLADVADNLRKGLGGLSEVQRAVALETIFGSDASRAAKFIMDAGRKGVEKYVKATSDQKSAQDLANTAMSGASGAWQNFTGSVETATITLGQKALPKITDLLNLGTDLVNDAKGWGDDFREYFGWMSDSAKDLYNAAKPLGSMLAGVAGFINDLPGPVKEVGVQVGIAAFLFPRMAAGLASVASGFMVATTRAIGFSMALRASGTAAQTAALGKLATAARTAAGIGGMVLLTQSMNQTSEATAGMLGALGGAALGFSMGGPLGAAIGGVAGGLMGMNSVQQTTLDLTKDLGKATEHYTDTLDANTGAITRATRAKAFDLLNSDKATSAAIKVANAYGISTRDIVSSTLGNRAAQERLSGALATLDSRYNRLKAQGRDIPKGLEKTREALQQITDESGRQRATLGADLANAREKARATMKWGEALKGIPVEVKSRLKAEGYDASRKDLDALVREFKLVPDQKRTLYQAFGVDTARNDLANMTREWEKVPAAMKDLGIGDAAAGVAVSTQEIGANLATLRRKFSDTQLKVFIRATGSDTTVGEVRKATRAFRQLPDEVATNIRALGGNATRADIRRVAREAGVTDKTQIRLMFGAIGVEPTRRDIRNIKGELDGAGKKPANLQPWKRGLTDAISDGKRTVTRGATDLDRLLGGTGRGVKPDLNPFLGAITSGIVTGRANARTGSAGIGADLKSGFSGGFSGAGALWSGSVAAAVNQAIAAGRRAADAHSPSRKTARLGGDMADGLAKGMTDKRKRVIKSSKDLIRDVIQAYRSGGKEQKRATKALVKFAHANLDGKAEKRVIKMAQRQSTALKRQYALRAQYAADEARAQNTLQSRQAAKTSFVDTTYQGMYQQANVLNAGNNAGTIAASLKAQVGKVQEFARLITRLKKMGYRDDVVTQIAQAGVENGIVAARALANATSAEQSSINQSYATIASTASTTANALGASLHDAGIRAAQGLVAGLKAKRKDVEATIMGMAMAMQKALRKALGIKSPSRVMAALGRMTGQGLVNGLLDREKDVARAGTTLARSIVMAPPRIPLSATVGTRGPAAGPMAVASTTGTTVFQFTTHNPVAEPQSRTTNKALDKAANLGLV